MERMRVHPNASLGVQMGDGTVYKPDRTGLITVSDPKHEREIRTSYNRRDLDLFSEVVGNFHDAQDPGRPCTGCGFTGWSWQTHCPKGHPLSEPREEAAG